MPSGEEMEEYKALCTVPRSDICQIKQFWKTLKALQHKN